LRERERERENRHQGKGGGVRGEQRGSQVEQVGQRTLARYVVELYLYVWYGMVVRVVVVVVVVVVATTALVVLLN
jgi:hypothetical protein